MCEIINLHCQLQRCAANLKPETMWPHDLETVNCAVMHAQFVIKSSSVCYSQKKEHILYITLLHLNNVNICPGGGGGPAEARHQDV